MRLRAATQGGPGPARMMGAPPGYRAGTRIHTPGGAVAIERLALGDLVLTASGEARSIRWIGRRSFPTPVQPSPDILPISFAPGSLAPGLPARTLHVSPLLGLLIDGTLVGARALVNGANIIQAPVVDQLDYLHLAVDSHDILLAEGVPAESWLDEPSRALFADAADPPTGTAAPAVPCAPRLGSGAALQAIRRRLDPRPVPPRGPLQGHVDGANARRVWGWAWDGAAVELELLVGGTVVTTVVANEWRGDVASAWIGDGYVGFDIALPRDAPPGTPVLRRTSDQAVLDPPVASWADTIAAILAAGDPRAG